MRDISVTLPMNNSLSEHDLREPRDAVVEAVLSRDNHAGAGIGPGKHSLQRRPLRYRLSQTLLQGRGFVERNIRLEIEFGHHVLFIPVLIGIGAVTWFGLEREPSDAAIMALLAAVLVWSFLMRRADYPMRLACRAAVFVVLGMVLAMTETRRNGTIILDSPVTCRIEGTVISREIDHEGHWRYQVQLSRTAQPQLKRPPQRVSLLARSRHTPFEIGQAIAGKARLSPPSGPALPGLNDFAFDAYFNGVGAVGFFYGPPHAPQALGRGAAGWSWQAWLKSEIEQLRGQIGIRIRSVLPGDTGAFATAIVTDERRAISPETTEALRLAGLAHIIAISGLNMALAAGIFFVGLRSLLSLSVGLAHSIAIKKLAASGALLAVSAYFMVSGFAISAERAYIMMVIMLVAVFFDVSSISLRNVALSALVIVVLYPSALMGPSFQMSYSATAALVAGYSFMQTAKSDDPARSAFAPVRLFSPLAKLALGIFLTSMIGGLSTAVYSVEHFHRIAAFGLVANLAAMPVISFVVMPAALIAMLLMPFGLDRLPLVVMGEGLDLVIAIAKWTSAFGGDVVLGRMPGWFMPAMSAALVILVLLKTALRYAGIPIMAGAFLVLAAGGQVEKPDLAVSEDGRLVGLIDGRAISTNRDNPPDFIFQQWQRALQIEKHMPPEFASRAVKTEALRWSMTPGEQKEAAAAIRSALPRLAGQRFICRQGAWCMARHHGGAIVATVDDPAHIPVLCSRADIVITSHRWKQRACANGKTIISLETLRQSGSIEVLFAGPDRSGREMTIITAIGQQRRAWTMHRFYHWRTNSFVIP